MPKNEKSKTGLEIFEGILHPEVVGEIRGWTNHTELSKLLHTLESRKDREPFFDIYAEAMVARHLISQGCELKVEIKTIKGKGVDFKVSKGSNTFFVHIKRTNLDKETTKNLKINTRLNCLRKICRPITVSLIHYKSLTDQEMQYCCKEAKEFIENASEGDRKEIKNMNDEALAEFEIGPCHNGHHVIFDPILPEAIYGGNSSRYLRQLKSAYEQFMPNEINVILITSAWRDSGSIMDLRDDLDDFWSIGENPDSNIIGYFTFEPNGKSIDFELIFREGSDKPLNLVELFECN